MLGMDYAAWCETDRTLAQAYTMNEAAKCRGCGHYIDESTDDDMDGWYEVHTVQCHACAARDRHEKAAGGRHTPGELVYMIDTRKAVTDG